MQGLLISSEFVGCFIEGAGSNFLRPDEYKPVRGDHGPWPGSGYPYVIHALLEDNRNIAFLIKYDDPTLTGKDLARVIGQQIGKNETDFTVYYNGHPVNFRDPLASLGLHFQDKVTVAFSITKFKDDDDGRVIEGNFFSKTGDSQLSLHGIAP
jgi:hypothetical protein